MSKTHTPPPLQDVVAVINQCEQCQTLTKIQAYKEQGAVKGISPSELDRLASARLLITGEGTDTSCGVCVNVMMGHIIEYLTKQGVFKTDEAPAGNKPKAKKSE